MAKQMDIGALLGETVALVQDNLQPVLIFTAVIGGLTAFGTAMGLTESTASLFGFGDTVSQTAGLAGGLLDLAVAIGTVIGLYWLSKTYLASRNRIVNDENRFWPYVGLSILSAIGLVVGFLLLIVPGIILMVRWTAASGYLLSGREGVVDSLRASWEVTRGNAMTIFLAGLAMLIVLIIVLGIITSVFTVISPVAGGVVSALMEALVNTITPAFGIAAYVLLQDEADQLEEVFS